MATRVEPDLELGHWRGQAPYLTRTIEDYPSGYPRFTALIASHVSYQVCRRFTSLRTRMLLLKQDRLVQLETRLNLVDRKDNFSLNLGSSRMDKNEERKEILADINESLADYDEFIHRHRRAMGYESTPKRAVMNLKRWVDAKACIARDETAFLDHGEELFSIGALDDTATSWLEILVEHSLIALKSYLPHRWWIASRDPSLHIFRSPLIRSTVRVLVAPLITMLLLSPVVACNVVQGLSSRLVLVAIASTSFIAVLSGLTRAGTVELIVAGATYMTVLVVFISSTNDLS